MTRSPILPLQSSRVIPFLFLLLVSGLLSLQRSLLHASEPLAKEIDRITANSHFAHSHWGALFVDQDSGETLFKHNSEKLFVPASTAKLYSTACALDALGPNFHFVTPVVRHGEVDSHGVLTGDLILVASGDLSFGGRTNEKHAMAFRNVDHTYANDNLDAKLTETDPLRGLNELARQIAAAGIKQVHGDVLIDHRIFEDADSSGSGPRRVTPCIINDNVIDILITPNQAGHPAKWTSRPVSSMIHIESKVTTAKSNDSVQITLHDAGHGKIEVTGKIPEGHKPVLRINEVHEPAAFARTLLIEALQRVGVSVKASPAVEPAVSALPSKSEVHSLPQVAVLKSPPFSDSVKLILKVSHNLSASALPLLVAAKHGEHTLEAGLKHQRDFLKKAGIETSAISFSGGAGGSRGDLISPLSTVQLLRYMAHHPSFPVYHDALPRLGVDGTLVDHSSHDSPIRDKLQAKTGTLYYDNKMNNSKAMSSKALAGYMSTAKGKHVVFAIFVNNAQLHHGITAKTFGEDLVKICEVVFRHE